MADDRNRQREEQLRHDLRNQDYREQFATSTLISNVSDQLLALRRQRGMTQGDLAKLSGTKQPRISYIEAPPDGDKVPNWEVDTLNRIARALGTRLKISFETYGSLLKELHVDSNSLRRPDVADDPDLFPPPPAPSPNPEAPERTRWMQSLLIEWLWDDKLQLDKLIGWLEGRGLPAVGREEEPYRWLQRGLDVPGKSRPFLEKKFAERLAILLGEEPDVHPLVRGDAEEFLVNLYWTCAGMNQPGFLAEPLWDTYKRLPETKPSGAVRDALEGALVQNQFGETKPLREIWEPMVERGRHRWLRGNEVVGYEGILVRHRTIKPDLEKVFWALGRISQRWAEGTPDQRTEFKRLMGEIPDLMHSDAVARMVAYAKSDPGDWSPWAQELIPIGVRVT